jgi:hypothetical protein
MKCLSYCFLVETKLKLESKHINDFKEKTLKIKMWEEMKWMAVMLCSNATIQGLVLCKYVGSSNKRKSLGLN